MIKSAKTGGHQLLIEQPMLHSKPLREELRQYSRYIRDTVVPLLSRGPKFTHSDAMIIHSIFKKLEPIPMTLDLLRFSRIEKALMVIANTGPSWWPVEVVEQAEDMIQNWDDQLGPLKNLRADLYGQGGRLEGLRRIDGRGDRDDDAKSAWSVEGYVHPSKAHRAGHLGFRVGDWWLKPAAAYRDGMIDETSNGITADNHRAYAIVLSGTQEQELRPDDQFKYHVAPNNPVSWRLTKTMLSDTDKVVRVLRSWKLRSKLAPKAGLRYDGLYRISGFGVKLLPPNSYHLTCTLTRIAEQPSMQRALHFPTADQLDDWKDYQHLKTIDRGDDFAFLREIIRKPTADVSEDSGGTDMVKSDSGYSSRRESSRSEEAKATSTVKDVKVEQDGGYFSRRTSGFSRTVKRHSNAESKLVAAGTPLSRSAESSTGEAMPESISTLETSSNFLSPAKAKPNPSTDDAVDYFDPHARAQWARLDGAGDSTESEACTPIPHTRRCTINDLSPLGSTYTISPTNNPIESTDTESAFGGAADSYDHDPGNSWWDIPGAVKGWGIVQGSTTSGRIRSTSLTSIPPESIVAFDGDGGNLDGPDGECFEDGLGIRLDGNWGSRVFGSGGGGAC